MTSSSCMNENNNILLQILLPENQKLFVNIAKDKTFGDVKNNIEKQTGLPRDLQLLYKERSEDIILDWICIEKYMYTGTTSNLTLKVDKSWESFIYNVQNNADGFYKLTTANGVNSASSSKFVETLPEVLDTLITDEEDGYEVFFAIFICISQNYIKAVQKILESFDTNYFKTNRTASDRNIYHAVALSGNEDMLKLIQPFCKHFVHDLLLKVDENNETPIILAQNQQNNTIASLLKDILKSETNISKEKLLGRDDDVIAVQNIEERVRDFNLSSNIETFFVPTSPMPLAGGSFSMQFPWLLPCQNNMQRRRVSVPIILDEIETSDEGRVNNETENQTADSKKQVEEKVRRPSLQQLVNVEAWRNKRLNGGRARRITIAGIQENEQETKERLKLQAEIRIVVVDEVVTQDDNDEKDNDDNDDNHKEKVRFEKPWNEWEKIKQKYSTDHHQRSSTADCKQTSEKKSKPFEEWMIQKLRRKSSQDNSKKTISKNKSIYVKKSIRKEEQSEYFDDWLAERKKKDQLKKRKTVENLKKKRLLDREKEQNKLLAKERFNAWLVQKCEQEVQMEEEKYFKRKETEANKVKPHFLPKVTVGTKGRNTASR